MQTNDELLLYNMTIWSTASVKCVFHQLKCSMRVSC